MTVGTQFIVPNYNGRGYKLVVNSKEVPPTEPGIFWMKPMLKGISTISRNTNGEVRYLALATRRFLGKYEFVQAALNEWTYGELFGYRTGLVPRMGREKFRIFKVEPGQMIVTRHGVRESFPKPPPGEPAWFWDEKIPATLHRNPSPPPPKKPAPVSCDKKAVPQEPLTKITGFLDQYKFSRFVNWDRPDTLRDDSFGFYRAIAEGDSRKRIVFYIFPAGWKEICRRCGTDPRQISKHLAKLEVLRPDARGQMQRPVKLPHVGQRRVYEINATLLFQEQNNTTTACDAGKWAQRPS